jgi:hypothetical protein
MQYTQTELAKLIETVETEFSGYLAKSEVVNSSAAPLVKAEDAKPEKKDEKSPEKKDAKPESKEEGKAPEHKEEGKAPEADAKAPEHKEEGKEAAPAPEANAEGKQEAGQEHGYDDEDMEHMHNMYASMSEGERKAHHDAIMKCAQANQAPAAPQGEGQAMAKSETATTETTLLKSELEATKAANEQLKKNLDGIQEFLTKLVKKTPQGKAITSLDVITKSEGTQEDKQMTKSEINSILAKKSADPTLTKSDREAINAFYLNDANFNTISHLLK